MVSGASENERLVKWAVGCAESKKAEAAGTKAAGPVFEVVKWDPQERGQEPTAEHAPLSRAMTAVSSCPHSCRKVCC